LAYSLHAHLCLLGQLGRALLRTHHPMRHPSRLVRVHHRPCQKDRLLHPHLVFKLMPLRRDAIAASTL
jgi:hypothetical protein